MENKDFESNYPDGECEYCGKIFKRPNKWRTETEAFHQYGCQLESIKKGIELGDYSWYIYELIDDLERISKVSSFGAKPYNKYWDRMVECNKIIKKLEAETNGN